MKRPTEVAQELIGRIEKLEPSLHAFAWFDPDWVRQQAKQVEGIPEGKRGPLWGMPLLVKDNICVKGIPTTCCSKILSGFKPPYDATVIERLKGAGAILLGMANMDEFAFGSSCEHSCYGPTKNPWDKERVPGGSSGGSAAAVAARLTPLALGSDTGGSIRQPASFCGVVGLKPTYGRVSRYGLIAFASSLDQIGPIAANVADCARLFQVIAGFDPRDSTSARLPPPFASQNEAVGAPLPPPRSGLPVPENLGGEGGHVKGVRIGIPKEYFVEGIDPEVKGALLAAIERLKQLGARVTDVSLPHTEYAIPTYYIVATAEASSNLARFDGVRFGRRDPEGSSLANLYLKSRGNGFGPEAKRRIILGTFVLSSGYYDAYYGHALKVRTLLKRDFDEAFEKVDCLVTPTAPSAAFKLGEKLEDPLTMYLSDICTISINLAGVPALSMPCGFTKKGLPIGMQLVAKPFDESTLFRVGGAYEGATDWHNRTPSPLSSPPEGGEGRVRG